MVKAKSSRVQRNWRQRWLGAPGVWVRQLITLACMVAVLVHVHGGMNMGGMGALERGLYDWRLRWLLEPPAESQVVIVDIDEASLAQVGHWPWSRQRIAELVDALVRKRGARTVAFDMVFAEPTSASTASGLPFEETARGLLQTDPTFVRAMRRLLLDSPQFAQTVRALKPQTSPDDALATAVSGAPVVLGYYLSSDRGGARYGQLPLPVWRPTRSEPLPTTTHWNGYGANMPQLAMQAPAGFFNSVTDEDGMVRRLPLLAEVDGALYESLALAAYRRWAGLDQLALLRAPQDVDPSGKRLQALILNGRGLRGERVAVDPVAAAWVNYRQPSGPGGAFTYVSAVDVLQGAASLPDLKGKLVLIGTSAPGLQDVRATPVAAVYPGVEAHASLIADLMRGQVAAPPPEANAWSWFMVLVAGVILVVVLPRARAWVSLLTAGCLVAGLMGLAWWAQAAQAWILTIAPAVALVLMALLFNMVHGFISERRLRRLNAWFGSYLPTTLVREMYANRQKVDMQADYRTMTVLFCDIRGFTGIAERLKPAQLQSLLNQVLGRLSECVGDARGTLDKYMGDSVMAFWGAPVHTADHAQLAVQCAQAMVEAMGPLNKQLIKQGLPPVRVGVGIATGEMFVGDMGSTRRRTYTVIGDAVNVASRLESMSKTLGCSIVANQATAMAVPDAPWQQLDTVAVRGRQQRQAIYGLNP